MKPGMLQPPSAAVLARHGLMRPDIVVAGKQVAGVILTLDRREPLIGLRWIDRGDILFGGRREEVCVGAVDARCEFLPDRCAGVIASANCASFPPRKAPPSTSGWIICHRDAESQVPRPPTRASRRTRARAPPVRYLRPGSQKLACALLRRYRIAVRLAWLPRRATVHTVTHADTPDLSTADGRLHWRGGHRFGVPRPDRR